METLSGQDAAFLAFEGPGRPMHVAVLATFESRGGSNPRRIRAELARRLARSPRFCERLQDRGVLRRPGWVPVPGFDPATRIHVLRRPLQVGSAAWDRTLDRLLARPLEPGQPLWEAWLVPDLDGGRRFALLVKAHHCMLDGASGAALLQTVLEPLEEIPAPGPRRVPARSRRPRSRRGGVAAIARLLGRALGRTSATPLNGGAHGHPRYALLSLDEDALRSLARDGGATVNDALLALTSGALRHWLRDLGRDPDATRLRALCPVNVRRRGETGLGNRLGAWLVDLPVHAADPRARLAAVRRSTGGARRTGLGRAVELLGRVADFLPGGFPALVMALAGRLRLYNLVVTHVPRIPLRLGFLGHPLESLHPFAPTFPGQRCSLAAIRYGGRVHVGITGAWARRAETAGLAAALRRAAAEDLPPAPENATSGVRAAG